MGRRANAWAKVAARAGALAGALALGACETGTFLDDSGTLIGEPSKAEQAAAARPLIREPVQAVRNLELGRTRDGFIITAYGTAPGLGYALPALQARRDGAPGPDGFLDYDFVARAPDPGFALPPGSVRSRALRADLPVRLDALRGAGGIRVHALAGAVRLAF